MRRSRIGLVAVIVVASLGLSDRGEAAPAVEAASSQDRPDSSPSPQPEPPLSPSEVAALKARIAALERELASARERIAQLEAELTAARAARPGAGPGAPSAEGGDSLLSPHDLLARLKERLAADFPDPLPADERAQRAHLRTLTQWVNAINREQRERIDWPCRILSRDATDAEKMYVELEAIDPQNGDAVSEPFVIDWPRRLRPVLARFDDGSPVRLRGLLTPQLRVNESRSDPGTFDIPPLLGPFVEFRYAVQVTALMELEVGRVPPPALAPQPAPPVESEPQR